MSNHEVRKQDEYKTLREELLQAKKYVFERPLLIVALGIGGLKLLEGPYVATLPPILAGLFLFNFWFTVNRLMSAARIVAYIQLEIEEGKHGPWVGWESCLRWYRKWIKTDPDKKKKVVDKEMDKDAIPDAMMYYPPIYHLHIVLMSLTAISSIAILALSQSVANYACLGGTIFFAVRFFPYTIKYRPDVMKALIERNRVIWHYVFEYMVREGEKK